MNRLKQLGEDRHARCRYGLLTPAWRSGADEFNPEWVPSVIPICAYPLPVPCPPAMKRQWGGSIELDRDCAVCQAFKEVAINPESPTCP